MTMRQGWDSEAANWAAFARTPGYDQVHEKINLPAFLELLPGPGRLTLDLACGEGRLGRLLRSLGHRVTGVDASPSMVRLAATHDDCGPVLVGDGTELPFRDRAFDLVVAYMCLQDIDELPAAVAELGRVLAPGGRACIAIPHPVNTAGEFESRESDAPFVIRRSYFDTAPLRFTAEREDVRLTFYNEHRPLDRYARSLEAAGLLIEKLREIGSSEQVAETPAGQRWLRIPLFLHLLVVRPPGAGPGGLAGFDERFVQVRGSDWG